MERLQKMLSRYGIASRRKAEQLILAGRVCINGNIAKLGDSVDAAVDQVEIDGKSIKKEPPRLYIMLNKPRGYVTTMHDERGRKTVVSLIQACGERLYPVGRLDMYSEGLLLFTNDGAAANKLMHPREEVEKVYRVWVSNYQIGIEEVLKRTTDIDGYSIRPPKVKVLHSQQMTALLEMTIHEGRNREIRKICQAAGLKVTRLQRVAEGEIKLGDLPVGNWRYLTQQEVAYIRNLSV